MKRLVRKRIGMLVVVGALVALAACDPGSGEAEPPAVVETPGTPENTGTPNPTHSLDVARRFAPLVILGANEKHRPMDATTFIEGSRLMWNRDAGCKDDVVEEHPTPRSLAEPGRYRRKESADNSLPLPCKREGPEYDTTQRTRPLDTEDLGDEGFYLDDPENSLREQGNTSAPVYVQYVDGTGANAGKTGYVYWFFYPGTGGRTPRAESAATTSPTGNG